MFNKILIANRGEIAVRIIKSARKMGIKTVAVYSDADRNALHVKEANEAVYIGRSASAESYLVIDNIIDAMQKTGADAVHPGYGFLSENASFAKRVEDEGLVFIAPPIPAIEKMGDKIASKKLAKKAGVSTVPGYVGVIEDVTEAVKIAKKIGYPVMIKASAGGGGKGMRIANNDAEVRKGFKASMSEAKSSFGDDRVFIEKYITSPRHIEIQVLADKYGNTIHLGERECSIQRRHQKVYEEAPSAFITEKVREKMGKQAVNLAKEVGYYSAGTVEFIVDSESNFYFLEMNTRLQVEHRVTELVTNTDLVEQMIKIAAGKKLTLKQKDIKLTGHAMEARIYAEDPARNFLPSIGRLNRYQEPASGDNVLVDSGVYEGGQVSMFYDPMISKLCSYGKDRQAAIDHMKKALGEYYISGVSTNIGFLESLVRHPKFIKNDVSTNFIEQEYPEGFSKSDLDEKLTKKFVAVATYLHLRDAERAASISGQLPGKRRQINPYWIVTIEGINYSVKADATFDGYTVQVGNEVVHVTSSWNMGNVLFSGEVNGEDIDVRIKYINEGYRLTHGGARVICYVRTPRVAELTKYIPEVTEEDNSQSLISPMSGKIVKLHVKEGETIKAGQDLVIIEAMKMENSITAEKDVKIAKINYKEGESVGVNEVIIEFEAV